MATMLTCWTTGRLPIGELFMFTDEGHIGATLAAVEVLESNGEAVPTNLPEDVAEVEDWRAAIPPSEHHHVDRILEKGRPAVFRIP